MAKKLQRARAAVLPVGKKEGANTHPAYHRSRTLRVFIITIICEPTGDHLTEHHNAGGAHHPGGRNGTRGRFVWCVFLLVARRASVLTAVVQGDYRNSLLPDTVVPGIGLEGLRNLGRASSLLPPPPSCWERRAARGGIFSGNSSTLSLQILSCLGY